MLLRTYYGSFHLPGFMYKTIQSSTVCNTLKLQITNFHQHTCSRGYYPALKTNKQHRQVLKTLCQAKARYKGTYSRRFYLYKTLSKLRLGCFLNIILKPKPISQLTAPARVALVYCIIRWQLSVLQRPCSMDKYVGKCHIHCPPLKDHQCFLNVKGYEKSFTKEICSICLIQNSRKFFGNLTLPFFFFQQETD